MNCNLLYTKINCFFLEHQLPYHGHKFSHFHIVIHDCSFSIRAISHYSAILVTDIHDCRILFPSPFCLQPRSAGSIYFLRPWRRLKGRPLTGLLLYSVHTDSNKKNWISLGQAAPRSGTTFEYTTQPQSVGTTNEDINLNRNVLRDMFPATTLGG